MAAFSNFHLSVAGALVPRASVFPARRAIERASIRFAAAAVRAAAVAARAAPAVGEIGTLRTTEVLEALNEALGPHIFPSKEDGSD